MLSVCPHRVLYVKIFKKFFGSFDWKCFETCSEVKFLEKNFGNFFLKIFTMRREIEICPNMGMGVAILGFFANFENYVPTPDIFLMMSSNYSS